ncbi:HAD family hydrolase [Photobacterium rosenbergii]|uniref:HAD family hydrolase n=1 Tax=Photobacterium rosenbergii TaxID=294936 RepID=UPI001C99F9DB|nr:HAD family hydrolase [Photobacterium rosenbergii]MBY5947295.1 HAD family hydrolase [Photobacterium rosenbergii]
MISLVIFDLDDTLYPEKAYFSAAFDRFEQCYGYQSGCLNQAFGRIDRKLSRDILKDTLLKADIYSQQNHDKLFECYRSVDVKLELPLETLHVLERLKRSGCSVALLTNGVVVVQQNKVNCLGIERWCDAVFYARNNALGIEKPDPRCFTQVLNHFGVPAEEAIMIGDSAENDYFGAKRAGLKALLLGGEGVGSIQTLSQALPHILDTHDEKN